MASRNDDGPRESRPRRVIYQVQELLYSTMRDMWTDLTRQGSVRESTRQELQRHTLTYYTILRKYRDHDAIKDDWPDATPFDGGPDAMAEEVARGRETPEVEAGTRGGSVQKQQAPVELSAWALYESARDLDDLATELGFAPTTRDYTPGDDLDNEDLERILENRGQDGPAERLPNSPGGS